jgi:hypothetical protein
MSCYSRLIAPLWAFAARLHAAEPAMMKAIRYRAHGPRSKPRRATV